MKLRILALSILGFVATNLFAQQDFIMYHMPSVPQITQVDPASIPKSRVNIGLPAISSNYFSLSNTGFSYYDIFKKQSDGVHVDINDVDKTLATLNHFTFNTNIDLLYVGFKVKENYLSFNVTEKVDFTFSYPKDMLLLALEGNGKRFAGNRVAFDGFGFDFTHWREYAVHWVHDVHHKFTYGGRLKYLYGMENMVTDISNIGITTDDHHYGLTLDADVELRTAGLPKVQIDSLWLLGGIDEDNAEQAFDGMNYALGRKNTGLGVDLGLNYEFTKKVRAEASVVDLGFINWKDYTSSTKLKDYEFTYTGVNPLALIRTNGSGISAGDFAEVMRDSLVQSLREQIVTEEVAYRTMLRTKVYVSGEYTIDHNNYISLTSYTSFIRKRWRQGLGLAYNYHLGRWLSATASYAIYNRSYSNVGLGLSVNLGPLQLYAMSDNVLAAFIPERVRNAHIHSGINLTFGRKSKDADGDGIVDSKDKCPDVKGVAKFEGCPDTDLDNIPDDQDMCPTVYGLPQFNGCPDTDGDGVGDLEDECIDVAGTVELLGCPDTDGDGLSDYQDDCPELPGTKENNGCPDSDGDGIVDNLDECPNKAGLKRNFGCPLTTLEAIGADGLVLMTAEMNEDGFFIFENLPSDKEYLFKLNGEDVFLSDELLILFKEGDKETISTVSQEKFGSYNYKFLPQEDLGMPLLVVDEAGNVLRTGYKNKDGVYVFENLPTDKEYLFKLDGEDAAMVNSDLDILIKNLDGTYKMTLKPTKKPGFAFDFLPNQKYGLALVGANEDGEIVMLDIEEEEVVNTAIEKLEFTTGSAKIRPQSMNALESLAGLLDKNKKWKIQLSGHTDNTGTPNGNLALSKRRAEAIKRMLVDRGVAADQVIVKYYGQTQPIASNDTEEGRQENRRVDMVILQ